MRRKATGSARRTVSAYSTQNSLCRETPQNSLGRETPLFLARSFRVTSPNALRSCLRTRSPAASAVSRNHSLQTGHLATEGARWPG